mmetsp:Transcript_16787/g.26121  ORF Transcript_16787/g.26121 Transcript_16787/m.26121 type:complete len:132 (-) Transcript_16787:68-463(-)
MGKRSELEEHKKLHRIVSCTHESCGWRGEAREREDHNNACSHQIMLCTACGWKGRRGEVQEHLYNNCPSRKVECEWCMLTFQRSEYQKHRAHCPKWTVYCNAGCGWKGSPGELKTHMENDCPRRESSCIVC